MIKRVKWMMSGCCFGERGKEALVASFFVGFCQTGRRFIEKGVTYFALSVDE